MERTTARQPCGTSAAVQLSVASKTLSLFSAEKRYGRKDDGFQLCGKKNGCSSIFDGRTNAVSVVCILL
jgi:hypothetical protein